MRIAILDLCVWLPEYQSGQAKFGDVIAAWALRGMPDDEFTVIYVEQGQPLPNVTAFDGYILSGSDKGVYDDAPWMDPLRAFLLQAKDAGKPLFGICFGHQLMAEVFGGKAEKVGDAEVGVRAFDVEGTIQTGHVWHQDQVTEIPPNATVIGSASYCPVAALSYDFPAMSVQFHPEYAPDYVSAFLQRSRGKILSAAVTDAAVAQFEASDVEADLFVRQAAKFFHGHSE
jgi:GMP synthase-like glutamine amidotransferase